MYTSLGVMTKGTIIEVIFLLLTLIWCDKLMTNLQLQCDGLFIADAPVNGR